MSSFKPSLAHGSKFEVSARPRAMGRLNKTKGRRNRLVLKRTSEGLMRKRQSLAAMSQSGRYLNRPMPGQLHQKTDHRWTNRIQIWRNNRKRMTRMQFCMKMAGLEPKPKPGQRTKAVSSPYRRASERRQANTVKSEGYGKATRFAVGLAAAEGPCSIPSLTDGHESAELLMKVSRLP